MNVFRAILLLVVFISGIGVIAGKESEKSPCLMMFCAAGVMMLLSFAIG